MLLQMRNQLGMLMVVLSIRSQFPTPLRHPKTSCRRWFHLSGLLKPRQLDQRRHGKPTMRPHRMPAGEPVHQNGECLTLEGLHPRHGVKEMHESVQNSGVQGGPTEMGHSTLSEAAALLGAGDPTAAIDCLSGQTLDLDGHLLMAEALWTQAGPGGTRESLKHYEAAEAAAGMDVSKQAAVVLGHGWALLQLKDPSARSKLEFAGVLAQKDGNIAAVDFVNTLLENAENGLNESCENTTEATWTAFVKASMSGDEPVIFLCGSIKDPLDEASAFGVAKLQEAGVKAIKSVNVSESGAELPGLQSLSGLSITLPQLYLKGEVVENWMGLDVKELRNLLVDAGATLRSEDSEPCHGVFSDGLEDWQIFLIDLISKNGLGDWDSKVKALNAQFAKAPSTREDLEEAWKSLAPLVKEKLEEQQEMPCGHSCNTCPTKHDCQLHDAVGQVRDIEDLAIQQGWDPVSPDRMKSRSESHGKDATWFDKSVKQQDYFGRPRAPTPESAEFYLEWSQTSRTAELSCGPPGCVANTSLKAFESGDLEYKMCTLSVMVHPTDFDDEYNVEKIEWIVINGKEALRDFSPRAPKGCETNGNLTGILDSTLDSPDENDPSLLASNVHAFNNSNKSHDSKKSHGNTKSSVARNNSKSNLPLYPCIRDLPLEGLVGDDGQVHVSGKISTAVDECAVNGNHFSGLVSITCFTRPTTTLPPLPATTTTTTEAPEKVKQEFKTKDSAHFRCKDPGCSAATVLAVDVYNLTSRKCFLTIRINQTDFDEQDGTKERIEFVKVNHNVTASDLKPGKNPCGEAIASGSLRKYEDAAVIQKQDVTDAITNGLLMVELKITDMVHVSDSPAKP
eukprot:symbB.v1.2.012387.t1/scaffold857.1/size218589/2